VYIELVALLVSLQVGRRKRSRRGRQLHSVNSSPIPPRVQTILRTRQSRVEAGPTLQKNLTLQVSEPAASTIVNLELNC